ncbi:MAG: hypothetical protein JRG91_11490 [Deltaproteobacteria bacterium]|nr:hypothetical protein [Deltaproteobacteria bacterium]
MSRIRYAIPAILPLALLAFGCNQAVSYAGDAPTDTNVEGEAASAVCGDGLLGPGEACDDSNTETEACDTRHSGACLADCSLLMEACGNGEPDRGEQCDDGDADSMDGCTTSCTLNDQGIGAPCECTAGCSPVDPTAGTIAGCDGVSSLTDGTREVACLRSANEPYYGVELYFAEGYCTLLALGCEGDACALIADIGDVHAFSCPEGFAIVTREDTQVGTNVTTKTCHPVCTSDSECRWNAEEDTDSPWPGCGEYACVPAGDGYENICFDPRNPR